MTPQTTELSSTNEIADPSSTHQATEPATAPPSLSRHYTLPGRQCRLRALDGHHGLCFRHAALNAAALAASPSDSSDLSADLLPGHTHFTAAEDLREFLSRLLVQTTKGRVSPRRAAVLAYITNQLSCILIPSSKRNWPTSPRKSSSICLSPNATKETQRKRASHAYRIPQNVATISCGLRQPCCRFSASLQSSDVAGRVTLIQPTEVIR